MPTKQEYGDEIKRKYAVTMYDNIPECAALNKRIAQAYIAMDDFAVKYHVRDRQLPPLLLKKYNALIRTFDTLVAERDAIANAHRRADNELLAKEYGLEFGQRYYYPIWGVTGIVYMSKEGYITFVSDDPEIWPVTLWRDNIAKLVRTDTVQDDRVRTQMEQSIVAITDIPALERARIAATGRLE